MIEQFLKTKREPSRKKLKSLLKPFLEFLKDQNINIDEFDEGEVVDYIREGEYSKYTRSEKLSNTTLEQIYEGITNLVKWQKSRADTQEEHFKHDKRYQRISELDLFGGVERLKGRKWLKMEELDKLLTVTARKREEDYAILYLLGYFGCRVGELLKEKNRIDISFEDNRFNILTEKGKFERINYFDNHTAKIFRHALRKGWLDKKFSYHRLKEYRLALDDFPDDFTPHNLRYTANHHFKKVLKDRELVSLMLGWKLDTKRGEGSKMTQYYDDRKKDIKKAMMEKHYYNNLEGLPYAYA